MPTTVVDVIAALLLFAGSLALLLVAARIFTGAAERLGLALGLSPFVVGVLIVAVGTSLPELVASLLSVRAGTSEIVAGNVLGANATNLLLILGAVGVAIPAGRVSLGEQYLLIDLHYLLGATLLLAASMLDGMITPAEGAFLLATYVAYTVYLVREGSTPSAERTAEASLEAAGVSARRMPIRDVAYLLGSGGLIYIGGSYTVDALAALSTALGISPAIASVTILSVGTTLPELAVSVTAARRGLAALAVGNILGSCVFNALVVSGAGAVAGGVTVPPSLLAFSLPFVSCATLLFYLLTLDKRISRWEGVLFLLLFAFFMAKVAGLA